MIQRRRSVAGKALTALFLEVFRLNGRLLAAGDRLTRPVRQSSARWQVLGAIHHAPLTVSQIARAMGLARQSVQRTADRLKAERLVSYADNPAHRRAKLVRLTTEGRSVLDWITERQVAWVNRLVAGISETDLTDGLELLRVVRKRLESSEFQRADRLPPRLPARKRTFDERRVQKGDEHAKLR
jgi:DNA-binding MarR family transcriptional regulator